jgi:hypothetical protein
VDETIGLGGTLMIYVGTLSFVLIASCEKFRTPTSGSWRMPGRVTARRR